MNTTNNKCGHVSKTRKLLQHLLGSVGALALVALPLRADTFVPTTIETTTWTAAGNNYVIPANSRVANNSTLTIEPGVVVILGPGVSLNVDGQNARIRALGTDTEPIVIRAASPAAKFNSIWVPDIGGAANSAFRWCTISNALAGIWLGAEVDETETQEVSNCIFEDCGNGIQGWSTGQDEDPLPSPSLNPVIQNCRFSNCTTNGIVFTLRRTGNAFPHDRPGWASPQILNNTFVNIGDTAIAFQVEIGGGGQPRVINNSIYSAQVGIYTRRPYDLLCKNNVLTACGAGIVREAADSLSLQVNYNNLYNNGTNFVNYPSSYGTVIWNNANGDPADINFNISEDPLFADLNLLTLSPGSRNIDAGDSAGAYLDGCMNISLGTTVNDIGAYGGPHACNWLATTSTTFALTAEQCVSITINPSTPGMYRLDYTSASGNTNVWTPITNVNLLSTPWTYIDFDSPGVGQRYYRGVLLQQ
jgi:hypothetical protein